LLWNSAHPTSPTPSLQLPPSHHAATARLRQTTSTAPCGSVSAISTTHPSSVGSPRGYFARVFWFCFSVSAANSLWGFCSAAPAPHSCSSYSRACPTPAPASWGAGTGAVSGLSVTAATKRSGTQSQKPEPGAARLRERLL